MSRVFITQQPKPNAVNWVPNLSPAAQFGAFNYIFGPDDKPWLHTDWALDHAAGILREFNQEEDYILWPNTGDPAGVWAVMLVLARMNINKIRVLCWERKLKDGVRSKSEGFYSPITFQLPY
jgi:hypothetical protein